jgi:hypothetical protein
MLAEKLASLETLEGKVLEDIFKKTKAKTKAKRAKPPARKKADLPPAAS